MQPLFLPCERQSDVVFLVLLVFGVPLVELRVYVFPASACERGIVLKNFPDEMLWNIVRIDDSRELLLECIKLCGIWFGAEELSQRFWCGESGG